MGFELCRRVLPVTFHYIIPVIGVVSGFNASMKGPTMRQSFVQWDPAHKVTVKLRDHAVEIADEYARQGYALTLRQLYYQLVARDYIPNDQSWYKRLTKVVTKARMAGYIDWDAIVDRGRVSSKPSDWPSPKQILIDAAYSYRRERWQGQDNYVEVWCEKDALSSIIEPVTQGLHVRYLACRGYASTTAIYDGYRRIEDALGDGKSTTIIYLGDHDPSGIDMTRDIQERLLTMMIPIETHILRIALNRDQVATWNPPPNPTKLTDTRSASYTSIFGYESWELDALEPRVLDNLVRTEIEALLDRHLYDEQIALEKDERAIILATANRFDE